MSGRSSFRRKVIYAVCVALLAMPIYWLSAPATRATVEGQGAPGGKLAQLQAESGLTTANLGDIDPTSQAMQLATLGMRGVAVNVLWMKATEYQKTRNWTGLSAMLEQIIKLQPHFVAVWRFQSWNLSYNVSADWDDFRDRYYWVIKGINFIKEGERYNRTEAVLPWNRGWTTGHKIGRADERVEYRKLFRADDEFHGDRPVAQRDNWLVAKETFRGAEELVETTGKLARGISPILFFADAPKSQINYAAAAEEDGVFGEVARVAWNRGAEEWENFGQKDVPYYDGRFYRLENFDAEEKKVAEAKQRMFALDPELEAALREKVHKELRPEEQELLKKDRAVHSDIERMHYGILMERMQISTATFLEELKAKGSAQYSAALEIQKEIEAAQNNVGMLESSRTTTAYPYWKLRCHMERTPDAIAGREHMFAGRLAMRDNRLEQARDEYLLGFTHWRKVMDEFPSMMSDGGTAEEVVDEIRNYEECLKQLDEPRPEDFVLQPLLEKQKHYYVLPR